jgi:hypothetical protein
MISYRKILVAFALTALPLAARADPAPNPCGDLPALFSTVNTLTMQARDLVQLDLTAHPDFRNLNFVLNDLNYVLNVVIPTYSPYANTAASRGTPGGGAWAYQVHAGVIYAEGLDAELNDAEHWLIGVVAAHSLPRSFDAVGIIVSAHNAATDLDLAAMLCYMST